MKDLTLRPIGVVRSPHTRPEDTPIQPVYARGVRGTIELLPEYEKGLEDIEGFSHIYVIFQFHRSGPGGLTVTPHLDTSPHGVFATRAPKRPNPIGMSLVRLLGRAGTTLEIADVDMLDGTPVLDIKPYAGRFDVREGATCGWQDGVDEDTAMTLGRRGFRGEPDAQ